MTSFMDFRKLIYFHFFRFLHDSSECEFKQTNFDINRLSSKLFKKSKSWIVIIFPNNLRNFKVRYFRFSENTTCRSEHFFDYAITIINDKIQIKLTKFFFPLLRPNLNCWQFSRVLLLLLLCVFWLRNTLVLNPGKKEKLQQ